MTIDDFDREFKNLIGDEFTVSAQAGKSNVARVMDGGLFLGGPNLRNYSHGSYGVLSAFFVSPSTRVFFCIKLKGNTKIAEALAKFRELPGSDRTNNTLVCLIDRGVFLSVRTELNSGHAAFDENFDSFVDVEKLWIKIEGNPSEAASIVDFFREHAHAPIEYLGQVVTSIESTGAHPRGNVGNNQSAMIVKPFLVLAGISGTGKTRWVRKIAQCTGDGNSNLCMIAVRPDWHEPSDLMGYVSRTATTGVPTFVPTRFLAFLIAAWKDALILTPGAEGKLTLKAIDAMIPHWVCLDEMNLAPVEQYFADYLSVLESRVWEDIGYSCDPLFSFEGLSETDKSAIRSALFAQEPELWGHFKDRGIPLPPNLVVVGTVNMDETTHAFSRKVLDRAFTVEFDAFSAEQYRTGKGIDPVFGIEFSDDTRLTSAEILSTTTSGKDISGKIGKEVGSLIDSWNATMAETPFRVAYRTLNESLLYAASKGDAKIAEALEGILMMKLLPRLEGDVEKLGCDDERKSSASEDQIFPSGARNTLLESVWTLAKSCLGDHWESSKSKRKLHYMAKRLSRSGYTSFWP